MRENDDDAPVTAPEGSLADGLGETAEPGAYESSGEPYGDTDFGDDSYGDDSYDDDSTDDDSYGTDDGSDDDSTGGDGTDVDDSYGEDSYGTDGTYGDGDGTDSEDVDDTGDGVDDVDTTVTDDGTIGGDEDLLAQDNSPLEGLGFLLDEVREALFGEDDAAAASPFDTDPAEVGTDTDLDLTGDGLVDRADLHEAASSLDFDVSGGHHQHGPHDDGVIDA